MNWMNISESQLASFNQQCGDCDDTGCARHVVLMACPVPDGVMVTDDVGTAGRDMVKDADVTP
eukprot:CAMPEP_0114565830 /NCGR_PEP_ID=MMETSP0114-20121206/14532_1 /TAXON_ID=31324 /ORGANISM="Goniomonas sp, Strain m" /LENGTH=62 /DNA_ID=CAMNT_0001752129 /DNA_START=93 /DNA_END=281 /DNA_ORIENTATION=-